MGINRPIFREVLAFDAFAERRLWRGYEVCGLFSPKFFEKANIDARAYLAFVEEHADADVFLFHPFPRENMIANHFLELAELEHPGMTVALNRVWEAAFGRSLAEIDMQSERVYACHCNYFLARPVFWEEYGRYIRLFKQLLLSEGGNFLRDASPYTLTRTEDRQLPLGVFAFERSLSHFLFDNRRGLKVVNIATHAPSWRPHELFAGEAAFVSDLLAAIAAAPGAARREARTSAVSSYYYRRKIGVLSR